MLDFTASDPFTLGVEIELQIIDRETGDQAPLAPDLLSDWTGGPTVQPELFQPMLEVNTHVCRSASEGERNLRSTASPRLDLATRHGVRFISTGPS